ncbi:hypothetical protein [Anditalea andensis]|uniref:Uncharacterized protein n=1 Tax=Anditalea andensis TaxID=1048983 RepID=A0A074LNY9_9BACT|nr:hypothetical protein [Anditalea andensis]KEO75602.1 hypothetical protein EL17_00475 [Anditalea andensis]
MKGAASIIFLGMLFFGFFSVNAQTEGGLQAYLKSDTLTLENSILRHQYLFNGGDLKLLNLWDKRSDKVLEINRPQIDFVFGGISLDSVSYRIHTAEGSAGDQPYKEVVIIQYRGGLEVKRRIKLFGEAPAVRHQFEFRGKSSVLSWERVII